MSQEVSNGRTSTSVFCGRLQTASGRSGGFEWPLDRIGGQGTWPARFRVAALGGATRGRAGADGGVAAPHNAGDAAVGGPRGRDRPFAARERAAAHGARHFKKIDSDLCWSSEMRFRFIEDRRADYPVTIMCDVLGVSPAGYYAWRSRPESARSAANRELVDDIKRVHRDACGRYGSPRVHAELRAQGRGASRGRIERLMRRHGIRAIMARPRRVRTTDSRHDFPIAPNLIERNFIAAGPNRIWLADITYVETDQGWLYLATVMDLYSRRIVGWAMEDHLRADLPLAALTMSISAQRPGPGLIHHSDRGVQYASEDYRKLMQSAGFRASMSRKGDCYDNAPMESFFHTLKTELVHHRQYATPKEATRDIFAYIEGFYNRTRRHSAIGYISPIQMELKAA